MGQVQVASHLVLVFSEGVGRGLIALSLAMNVLEISACQLALPVAEAQGVPTILPAGRIHAIPVPRFAVGTGASRLQRVVLPAAMESVAQGKLA